MKLSPLILLILILVSPLVASADTGTVRLIRPVENVTQLVVNDTIANKINDVSGRINGGGLPSTTEDKGNSVLGEEMIKNALNQFIVDCVNSVLSGFGGTQMGTLEDGTHDGSEVAVFAVAGHTVDPSRDPAMMEDVATTRSIYTNAVLILGAFLAIFLIVQTVYPDESASFLESVTGNYGYISVLDMVKFYINTCSWLFLGPALFFGTVWINNYLVEGQMLSVLDQVAFSSDNIGLYCIMGLLWLFSMVFFAVRLVSIVITTYLWYMYGLGLAFKKTRWAAMLIIPYELGIILSQFIIIWICCIIVSYTASQELGWFSVSFVYLGLFCTVAFVEFLTLTWPILWALLSPRTLKTAVRLARYI